MKTLIKNANIINEGQSFISDVLIDGNRIEKIAPEIDAADSIIIEAKGLHLFPGVIDDQVHFREPGLTQKGTIYTEAKAAVAGGITSFMDMPNTIPNTLTQALLEEKYLIASKNSIANYSFFMGINKDNLEEALKTDNENVCGITDDGLYFDNNEGILANYPEYLEKLFSRSETLIALHSENEAIIKSNTEKYKHYYGYEIPFKFHSLIRSEEACLAATKSVLEIAKKHHNRLHLFHISTLAEANLLDNKLPIRQKRITAEACIHHLWFSDKDYAKNGNWIKWNPAIKTEADKNQILNAVLEDRIDVIATDHAPHTIAEKEQVYSKAPSGGPLVQHAFNALFEMYHQGKISLEKIVEKTAHNLAICFQIKDRGFIREGYFADLVLVDLKANYTVSKENILSKCGWSPFEGQKFNSQITHTFVSGHLAYADGKFDESKLGERLVFER